MIFKHLLPVLLLFGMKFL